MSIFTKLFFIKSANIILFVIYLYRRASLPTYLWPPKGNGNPVASRNDYRTIDLPICRSELRRDSIYKKPTTCLHLASQSGEEPSGPDWRFASPGAFYLLYLRRFEPTQMYMMDTPTAHRQRMPRKSESGFSERAPDPAFGRLDYAWFTHQYINPSLRLRRNRDRRCKA